ncbi:hypothetical protein Esti_000883 [Eimeria stiedai]
MSPSRVSQRRGLSEERGALFSPAGGPPGAPSQDAQGGDRASRSLGPSVACFASLRRPADVFEVSRRPNDYSGSIASVEKVAAFEREWRGEREKGKKRGVSFFSLWQSLLLHLRPSDKWLRRLPLLGVFLCVAFGLAAFTVCFSLLLSSLLDELEKARIEVQQQHYIEAFRPLQHLSPNQRLSHSAHLSQRMHRPFLMPGGASSAAAAQDAGFAHAFEVGRAPEAAPYRRLQSVLALYPAELSESRRCLSLTKDGAFCACGTACGFAAAAGERIVGRHAEPCLSPFLRACGFFWGFEGFSLKVLFKGYRINLSLYVLLRRLG